MRLFFSLTGKLSGVLPALLVVALVVQLASPVFFAKAEAAALTEASIRLDRMGAGVAANTTTAKILVVVKPASTATEATVKITWPTTNAFTVSSTASDHTVSTTGLPSTYQGETLTSWPSIATATTVSGGDVTFPSGDLAAGTLYGFYITGGITNPSTGNAGSKSVTITTQASGPSTIDTSTVTVDTTTTNADQVTVSASVGSTFNFALGSNSISLGALSSGSITTGNVTVDVDSNASNGWIAYLRSGGASATLASATSGDEIASTGTVNGSVETVSAGTENYVVDVAGSQGVNSTGSLTEAAEYAGNGTTTGGTLDTTYQQIAQSTGQADSDTLTLTAIVAISTLTAAATDYTDTWEVVGAGNF